MRILILTPAVFPALTGNAITTERWRRSLTDRGIDVDVLSANGWDSQAFVDRLQTFRPDLVHVYHAHKSGALLLNSQLAEIWKSLPLVVSPGGTDINIDLGNPERRSTILQVLGMASLIVAQSPELARTLTRQMPVLASKIVTIPKATSWFGNEPYDLRKIADCTSEDILFLLPAGIRPVKGNLECLCAMDRVYRQRKNIRFIAAGPMIDAEYGARFEREAARLASFALWIRSIPPTAMRSAYESSDIVLNASQSEGLSNSLLEALAAGRPFLASDIPGNRQTGLCDGMAQRAGLLFDPQDPDDFLRKATELVDDASLRKELGAAARIRHGMMPSPAEEAEALLAAYRSALGGKATDFTDFTH
jgi:L-malate glycosyltransferase